MRLVGETFDVDSFGRDTSVYDGLLSCVHPPRAATDKHIVVGDIGHELTQRLDVTEVGGVLRQPAGSIRCPMAGHDEEPCPARGGKG